MSRPADEVSGLLTTRSNGSSARRQDCSSELGTPVSSAGMPLGYVPLLGHDVLVDDEGAAFVFVLPRDIASGGTVDPDAIIEDPLKDCAKIFVRRRNARSACTMTQGFEALSNGPVRASLYQSVVRAGMLRVLAAVGMHLDTFPSFDADEIFLKVSLDCQGDVIRRLALRYRYRLPVKASLYKDMDMKSEGEDHKGGEPMVDHSGRSVLAFTEYDPDIEEHLQGFRHIDVIRIVEKCLDEWLDLAELVKQNVIARYFAAVNYRQVQQIHNEWARLDKLLQIPNNSHDDLIRGYFGEMVSFLFLWFRVYTRMMVPLAVVGGLCAMRKLELFDLSLEHQRYIQVVFAFILTFWASCFNQVFELASTRAVRRWGMKDWSRFSLERAEYDPAIEGTWRLWFKQTFAEGFVVIFCFAFAGVLVCMESGDQRLRERGDISWAEYGPTITAALIRVVSYVWSKLAPKIVGVQNHRTEVEFNNALTWTLASVKIFVALFPFINTIFLKNWFEPVCTPMQRDGLEVLAWKVYGLSNTWPSGIKFDKPVQKCENGTLTRVAEDSLVFLEPFKFTDPSGQMCLHGCYPQICQHDWSCITNCMVQLEAQLWTVYVVHVLCTVLLSLVIPMALAKFSVLSEYCKVKGHKPTEGKAYTLLQFQAKCSEVANYEYLSWGGSQVDDFLELAIGFAMLTCFGIALPCMTVIALFSHIVEYHLLAYRMTNVTCRPLPAGAEGIGVWQNVFTMISELAVIVNVGMAVFCMHPMRHWEFRYQLSAFLILEHALLFLRKAVMSFIGKEPVREKRIDDFNLRVITSLMQKTRRYAMVTIPPEEQQSTVRLDISLGPTSAHLDILPDLSLSFL